jgi:hypothetical protein
MLQRLLVRYHLEYSVGMTVAGKKSGIFLLALYLEQEKSTLRFIQILGKRNEHVPSAGHFLT